MFVDASEEGSFLFSRDSRGVLIHIRFRIVMCGNLVTLSTFFVKAEPPALAVLVIIVNSHVNRRTHTSEAVDHHTDKSAIADTDDGIRFDGAGDGDRTHDVQLGKSDVD